MNGESRRLGRSTEAPAVEITESPDISLDGASDTVVLLRIPGTAGTVTVDLDQVFRRFLADTLLSASAVWWERRAATFEAARPRPTDFNGAATAAELAARDDRCRAAAEGCRAKAAAIRAGWDQ